MKYSRIIKNIFFIAITTVITGLAGCSDSDPENKPDDNREPLAQLQEGQIISRELTYGNLTIHLEDEMVNYGDEEMPVLFSVNKKISFEMPELEGVVFTTTAEKLDHFFSCWAKMKDMPYESKEDKTEVAYDVYDHFINLDIDFNLFVELVSEGFKIKTLMATQDLSRSSGVPANDVLYSLWANRKEIPIESRGAVKDVIGIVEGIVELYNVWNDFMENNQPVEEAVEGTCNFLNGADTDVHNYSLDNYFASQEYKLKYWVTGIWHSKFNYIIEGYTGRHSSLPGKYVPVCRIRTTYLDVKGPAFIGSGSYKFSPVVNVSQVPDDPTVQVNGMVQVIYGDCCCFRYYSYLNFSLRGDKGYEQLTFNSGK